MSAVNILFIGSLLSKLDSVATKHLLIRVSVEGMLLVNKHNFVLDHFQSIFIFVLDLT